MTRDRDPATSHRASFWPDPADALDSFPDILRDRIAAFHGPLPATAAERIAQFFGILTEALKEANLDEAEQRGPRGGEDPELVEGLRVLAADRGNLRAAFRAACLLKQLGLDPRSDDQLARDYGLSARATAQNIRRRIEERTGVRCRSSKSDGTRERCRQRRLGQRRPARTDRWVGFELYERPISDAA